ncbi:F-box/FBD/LRR-repeat protein At1g13570-like [Bidens hawaiensis]|uniref:F-box/FBD/LRR-repeat protein At1g13570-like n=1 Tax=Bidens hawaiensis TaxID=980011 RepID=UPI00404969AD
MEHENPTGGGKRTQCINSDIISTLPQNMIGSILSLMPLQDAVRTSVLSKKWWYSWHDMPKLKFANDMVEIPSNCVCERLFRYKIANAMFQVLLLHNGLTIVEFNISVGDDDMQSEFAQIISYLAKINCVKDFTFLNGESFYKLSPSFFSLQGLESIHLQDCAFEPPLLFNKFSCLKSITFVSVKVSAKMLQRFLSNCPLLEYISLDEDSQESIHDFVPVGNKFSFADLLQCVPLIQTLEIYQYYMKMYDNVRLLVRHTPINFLNLEDYPDLKLDHLERLVMVKFSNLPLQMEFVKLIMAKSLVLKKTRIWLDENVSIDEELKMLRDLMYNYVTLPACSKNPHQLS